MDRNEQSLASFENISSAIDTTITDFRSASEQVEQLAKIVEGIGESSDLLENAANQLKDTIETF